jgi:hypothetical protein
MGYNTWACLLKARTMKPAEAAIAGLRHCKYEYMTRFNRDPLLHSGRQAARPRYSGDVTQQ